MFEKLTDPTEVLLWPGQIPIRHRYTPGVAGEAFFRALKDRGEFLGSRCASCGITYCPARLFCERCFSELEADTRVGPGGVLESFTVGSVGVEGEPLEEPVMVALVRLDGADSMFLHFLVDTEDAAIGERVEAVLEPKAKRTGSILDIRGFRPARR
ncbi:MAG TPA: Zn-ribbon domain-containing OB-fold protein [Actinomycetota bacterium]|nr:Zn-ribbon domain-containing OB-fold protein [Actinomycetota bacterium]